MSSAMPVWLSRPEAEQAGECESERTPLSATAKFLAVSFASNELVLPGGKR